MRPPAMVIVSSLNQTHPLPYTYSLPPTTHHHSPNRTPTSSPTSAAFGLWVSAPIEMKSTPASA